MKIPFPNCHGQPLVWEMCNADNSAIVIVNDLTP